jgi:hypothetical protein
MLRVDLSGFYPHQSKDTGDISEVRDTHKGDSVILSIEVIMIVMAGK